MGRPLTAPSNSKYLQIDPYVENSFGVVLSYNNSEIGTFTSVSGGAIEIAVIPYTLNIKGRGSQGILMPGACGPEPVTLSYGVTDDIRFWQWWTDMASGYTYRRVNLSLVAFGPADKDGNRRLAEWNLEQAWPSRISGFNFDLDSTSAFIAEVTLAVENIYRETPQVKKSTTTTETTVSSDKVTITTTTTDEMTSPDQEISKSTGYDLG